VQDVVDLPRCPSPAQIAAGTMIVFGEACSVRTQDGTEFVIIAKSADTAAAVAAYVCDGAFFQTEHVQAVAICRQGFLRLPPTVKPS